MGCINLCSKPLFKTFVQNPCFEHNKSISLHVFKKNKHKNREPKIK